jgi:hypothetical protein
MQKFMITVGVVSGELLRKAMENTANNKQCLFVCCLVNKSKICDSRLSKKIVVRKILDSAGGSTKLGGILKTLYC